MSKGAACSKMATAKLGWVGRSLLGDRHPLYVVHITSIELTPSFGSSNHEYEIKSQREFPKLSL